MFHIRPVEILGLPASATGLISGWFVDDLVPERPDARAKLVSKVSEPHPFRRLRPLLWSTVQRPTQTLYAPLAELYKDLNVDCVYIGPPHSFDKQNYLGAIAAGKNDPCGKVFTINVKEAKEVVEAAHQKNVYLAEAMCLRSRLRSASMFATILHLCNLSHHKRSYTC
jgi:hypothetical protein